MGMFPVGGGSLDVVPLISRTRCQSTLKYYRKADHIQLQIAIDPCKNISGNLHSANEDSTF